MGAALLPILGLIGTAMAEEPRYHPPVGWIATYRFLSTAHIGAKETTLGHVYRLTTTQSSDTGSEATVTILAMLFGCPERETGRLCSQARDFPGATRDGDIITVPVPPEIAADLAKIGKVSGRDFVRVTQEFPILGAENMDEIAKPKIGAAPLYIQTTKIACDDAAIKPFFPLGAAATLSVPCKMTNARSQSRWAPVTNTSTTDDVTIDLSFAGRDRIRVAAGDFDVASVKYKITPAAPTGSSYEGDWQVIETTGSTARATSLVHFPDSDTTRAIREMIKSGS